MRVGRHRPAVGIGQRDLILSDPAAGTSLVFEKPGMMRLEGHGCVNHRAREPPKVLLKPPPSQ